MKTKVTKKNSEEKFKVDKGSTKVADAYLLLWDLPNGSVFGLPFLRGIPLRLQIYNTFYNEKKEGFSYWIRNNFGEEPVLLSDVDGLYTANPRVDPSAHLIPEVAELTPEIEAMAGDAGTEGAKGGMRTKILAAKIAMQGGCAMAVMKGDADRPLSALVAGARATWFRPQATAAAARKQWIAGMKPIGGLIVDPGAVAALHQGKSLMPAGVKRVEGRFERGDPVTIMTETGETVGAALAGYNSGEARAIAGQKSNRISGVLGYPGRTALVHRGIVSQQIRASALRFVSRSTLASRTRAFR